MTEMNPQSACSGCRDGQPNQLAHMEEGGCLNEQYPTEESEDAHLNIGACSGCGILLIPRKKLYCSRCFSNAQHETTEKKAAREKEIAEEEEEEAKCEEGRLQQQMEEYLLEQEMSRQIYFQTYDDEM